MAPSNVMVEALHTIDVGDRAIQNAKKELGIKSIRKDGQWYNVVTKPTKTARRTSWFTTIISQLQLKIKAFGVKKLNAKRKTSFRIRK